MGTLRVQTSKPIDGTTKWIGLPVSRNFKERIGTVVAESGDTLTLEITDAAVIKEMEANVKISMGTSFDITTSQRQ